MGASQLAIAICDDDEYFVESLNAFVHRYLSKRRAEGDVEVFLTGEELLDAHREFDIVFMDIMLPGKNGVEIVEQLRKDNHRCQVIFISSCREYALEAFDLEAVHYCLKPVSDDKLSYVLDKAIKSAAENGCKMITIARGGKAQRINMSEIVFCEAMDHKIYIHTSDTSFEYFGTLDLLQTKLDDRFFRCHKSYIINLSYVINKEHDMATVAGGGKVLISRRKQQEFTQRLLTFLRKEVL